MRAKLALAYHRRSLVRPRVCAYARACARLRMLVSMSMDRARALRARAYACTRPYVRPRPGARSRVAATHPRTPRSRVEVEGTGPPRCKTE